MQVPARRDAALGCAAMLRCCHASAPFELWTASPSGDPVRMRGAIMRQARIQSKEGVRAMPAKAPKVTLTCSQAACLIALRHGKYSKTTIAIEAKLDLIETSVALAVLARLGLACENTEERTWHATPRGKACRYQLSAERPHRKRGAPRGSGWRLLALLDRPRRGKEIAEKLGLSPQRVHQLVVKLHAGGYLRDSGNDFSTNSMLPASICKFHAIPAGLAARGSPVTI